MSLRTSTAQSMVWLALEAGCSTVLSIISTFLMARFIGPTIVGLAALAIGLIMLLNLLVEALFQDALVQRLNLTPEHEHTAFTAAVLIGSILCVATVLAAGPLAGLFNEPGLKAPLQVLATALLLTSMNGVPVARLRRSFDFKALATRTLISRVAGLVIGPVLAVMGFGVWSYVAQTMVAAVIGAVLILSYTRYKPQLYFSRARFRELIAIALPILLTLIMTMARQRIFSTLVGFYLGTTSLGYINMAFRTVDTMRDFLFSAIYQLGISLFSREQADKDRLQHLFLQGTRISCLLAQPIFAGLIVIANTLIEVILGEAWRPIVPLVRLLAVMAMLHFLIIQVETLAIALGRPFLPTLISGGMLMMMIGGMVFFQPETEKSALAVWIAALLASILALFAVLHALTQWRLMAVVGAGLPALVCAVVMACVIRLLDTAVFQSWSPAAALAGQVMAGAAAYAGMTALFNRQPMMELLSLLRTGLHSLGFTKLGPKSG